MQCYFYKKFRKDEKGWVKGRGTTPEGTTSQFDVLNLQEQIESSLVDCAKNFTDIWHIWSTSTHRCMQEYTHVIKMVVVIKI